MSSTEVLLANLIAGWTSLALGAPHDRPAAPLPVGSTIYLTQDATILLGQFLDLQAPSSDAHCRLFIDDFHGHDILINHLAPINIDDSTAALSRVDYDEKRCRGRGGLGVEWRSSVADAIAHDAKTIVTALDHDCVLSDGEYGPQVLQKYNDLQIGLAIFHLSIPSSTPIPARLECFQDLGPVDVGVGPVDEAKVEHHFQIPTLGQLSPFLDVRVPASVKATVDNEPK